MDMAGARAWVDRWDRQQERYIPEREGRFDVIVDVVAQVTANEPAPVVLDLGCGPGSLSARLAARLPKASIVALDLDPVLLTLARHAYPDAARFVDADLASPGWLALSGPVDAAVSTTALHWLDEDRLPEVYADLAERLRPGGVLVNGDNLYDEQPTLAELASGVRAARAERAGVNGNEEWAAWWETVAADPELGGLLAERDRRGLTRGSRNELPLRRHVELLRAAGFTEVGTVWQLGDDVVLVAVR
jgi:SAM-dependent methyltransferase